MKFTLATILAATTLADDTITQSYRGCVTEKAKALPYCDSTLSNEDRVDDLLSRLTLQEIVTSMTADDSLGNSCNCHMGAVDSVDLPQYMWLVETNTNVASKCIDENTCATTFVGPMGMGASFNKTSWLLKGSVFGNEMRAFNNLGWTRNTGDMDYIGLSGYGPNVNIARDPRFGRSSELPGEDPLVSGTYAVQMLKGMQEEDENGHPKMLGYLKHLTAYSTETNRGHDNYNISAHDLWDTYLPAYELGFVEGGATGAMCSYNAINGAPSCANDYILNEIVRGMWSPDAHVTTDCGAVANLRGDPINAPSDEAAVAMALNGGTDIEMGGTLSTSNLVNATDNGLVDIDVVKAAWRRSYLPLFRAGRFDDNSEVEWTTFGAETVNSEYHQEINLEAALQSMVLLKNDNNVLPLVKGVKVAVVGPMADARKSLLSSYAADEICKDQDDTDYACITSIQAGIAAMNGDGGETTWAKGVDINSEDDSGIQAAVDACGAADVCVVAVGIDKSVEQEGTDREDTALPGLQEAFVEQVVALGKPVVMVMVNGGALAIDNLVGEVDGIVEAFNPNVVGGKALGMLLFGEENRWGKLPVTMYPHAFIEEKEMVDYDMSGGVGRTYRYYTGEPLFEFGSGLSLASMEVGCEVDGDQARTFHCVVENVGDVGGDEVVMVFHSYGGDVDHPKPIKALRAFERVTVGAGEKVNVDFTLEEDDFKIVNGDGDKVLYIDGGDEAHVVSFGATASKVVGEMSFFVLV